MEYFRCALNRIDCCSYCSFFVWQSSKATTHCLSTGCTCIGHYGTCIIHFGIRDLPLTPCLFALRPYALITPTSFRWWRAHFSPVAATKYDNNWSTNVYLPEGADSRVSLHNSTYNYSIAVGEAFVGWWLLEKPEWGAVNGGRGAVSGS